jgi:hypothetical protein
MALEEKLKRLSEKASEDKALSERFRSEWIAAVNALYEEIEGWLQPWMDKGYLKTARTALPKYEEPLGDYEIDGLEITAGDETVVFEPYGMNVIRALGRIDVYLRGFKLDAQMLLLLEDTTGRRRWELWKDKYSGSKCPFEKACLERLLDELF